ncbi:hypothetical protein KKG31_03110 [Patescibacteria group bacterium]|nr:hypothetical protein [Patescibacteria group bacterium]MBU1758150.1 hypothetical protein [Patescibacteria group bacterium]
MVRNISPGTVVDADKLLIPYVGFKGGPVSTQSDSSIRLIAPSSIYYMLNTTYFTNQIAPTLGQANITDVTLDCGN